MSLWNDSSNMEISSTALVKVSPNDRSPAPIPALSLSGLKDVLLHLVHQSERQNRINDASSYLHSLNFLLNYSNATRARNLQEDYQIVRGKIEEGRMILSEVQHQIVNQQHSINQIDYQLQHVAHGLHEQGLRVNELGESVERQQHQLNAAESRFDSRLQQHEAALQEQERALQRLLSIRFRFDFAVDSAIVLISWWLSSSHLLNFFLDKFVGTIFSGKPRLLANGTYRTGRERTILLTKLLKLSLFLAMIRRLRQVALVNGLHSMVGSFSKYGGVALQTAGHAVKHLNDRIPPDSPWKLELDKLSDGWGKVRYVTSDLRDSIMASSVLELPKKLWNATKPVRDLIRPDQQPDPEPSPDQGQDKEQPDLALNYYPHHHHHHQLDYDQ